MIGSQTNKEKRQHYYINSNKKSALVIIEFDSFNGGSFHHFMMYRFAIGDRRQRPPLSHS